MEKNGSAQRGKVLVVEDVLIIALDIESILVSQGFDVAGPAPDLESAYRLLEDEKPDAAVLDINLQGTMTFPLARRLREMNIPFVFMTGYDEGLVSLQEFDSTICLEKPIDEEQLLATVHNLVA